MALFLLPILPLAPAQSTSDPWWGPNDRTRPTEGFAVRIPITVENKFDHPLRDPYVAVEIDFRKLLVEAGWTNETRGAEVGLRGFTLDEGSIRVVPYHRGFLAGPLHGPDTQPLAHRFYPALFEAPRARAFDAARNPAGTILFQIDAPSSMPLLAQEKRDFYVYATLREFDGDPPAVVDPFQRGALDAFLWGTTGTVSYGYEPLQPGRQHFVKVTSLATRGDTQVTVSTYEIGSFVPMTSTALAPNPFTLGPSGANRDVLIPAGKAYKIESSKPVRVTATGQDGGASSGAEGMGFMPGASGSFADDSFAFDLPMAGPGQSSVRIIKASPGAVTVRSATSDATSEVRTLTNAAPSAIIPVAASARLASDGGNFLVLLNARGQQTGPDGIPPPVPFPLVQVPSIHGGPSGTSFFSFVMNEKGYVRLCAEEHNASLRIIRQPENVVQLYPEGTLPNVPPYLATVGTFCHEVEVPRSASPASLYEFYSIPTVQGETPRPFRVFAGSYERHDTLNQLTLTRPFLGPWGGVGGVDYHIWGDAGMFGHYNDTTVKIVEERARPDGSTFTVERTTSLRRDQYMLVDTARSVDRTGRYTIEATKPISVFSTAASVYENQDTTGGPPSERTIPYAFHVPGRPLFPSVTIGVAEFRAPLVDVRSPSKPGALQDFLTTGPGSPVSYRVDVVNLGRWTGGDDLTDTITLSCSTPTGWRIDGCEREFTLGSRSSERVNLVITPSAEDVNMSRTILVEARSRSGAVPAQFKINVHVEIRYGVGMWFDVEDGRKTIDPPIGVDPAEEHRYAIVVKNTGSTTDTFVLTVEEPREGWEQELLLDGLPVTQLRLDGSESVVLTFRVKAPNAETAPQNIVSIIARSQSNPLAADVVNTATRIRPKVDLELTLDPQTRLARPNETVSFNVSTRNKGNDVFTIYLAQDSLLPKGWKAELPLAEITLSPNDSTVLTLRATPPPNARAGDLASIKIAAEVDTGGAGGRVPGDEISAIVVVRRVYDIETPPIAEGETLPGQTLRFVLPIQNRGNGQVNLELLPGAVEAAQILGPGDTRPVPDWEVGMDAPSVTLDLDQTAELPLVIEIPTGTPPGQYNLTFTTRLSREALQNLTVPISVAPLSRVGYEGADSIGLTPGRPVVLSYVARNTGNVPGAFDLRADAPSGWSASVSPARANLGPGDSVAVRVTLNASADAPNGNVIVRLLAQAPPATATPTDLRVEVARPQLYLSDVRSTGDLRAGELVLVTADVGNRGGIEASNVSVALVVDGKVVDRVLLARVPVGATSVATMSWVATQRGGDVRVVLDPEHEIALPTREDTERPVEFGSRLVPAPGLLALLVLAATLAPLARRKLRERDGK